MRGGYIHGPHRAGGDWARGFSVSDAYSAGVELAEAMLLGFDKLKGGCLAAFSGKESPQFRHAAPQKPSGM